MTQQLVLVVEHAAQCPPGWVGEWLEEAGCVLDVRRPYAGDELPDGLDRHRSLLVLGGPMDADADEEHPWLPATRRLLTLAARDGVPALGICLGHQLAALALGGSVHQNPRGPQIGVLDVGWWSAAKDDPLLGHVTGARAAVQWNNDVVGDVPPGAVVLAATPEAEVQAARFAPTVWGVQWHPEAGEEIVAPWADSDRASAAEKGIDVDERLAQVAAAHDGLRESWRPLAHTFAAMTRVVAASW
ncbi:MAG: type 1 glutamine amidotransferase [Actinomycetota bacterium]